MVWYYKLLIVLGIITVIFSSGMVTEYKFHLASEVLSVTKQLEKAQKGQNNIIKFNQELNKSDAKNTPCFNTKLPDDIRGLLK